MHTKLNTMPGYSGLHFIMSKFHNKQTITELEEQYSDVDSQFIIENMLDINDTYDIVKREIEKESFEEDEKSFIEESDVIINEL